MGVQLSPLRDQGSIKIHLQRSQFPTCSIRDKRRCIRNPNIEKVKSQGAKMASEKFCLRWNDFESNISVAFRELREEKDFFDVTLACDDSQVQAHKVILSACSPFFR